MVEVFYHNKKYRLPGSFNELSGKQLIQLAPLLSGSRDLVLNQLQVLCVLLQKSMIRFYLMPIELKDKLLMHIEWVYQENNLTAQLIHVYKNRFAKYYGPKSEFDNIELGEYHCTEIYYSMLLAGKGQEALDALVSVIYRRGKKNYDFVKDTDGDGRAEFNEHEIEYWAGKISHWPLAVKQAILLWYDGCRQHLIKLYPAVYKPSEVEDTTGSEKGMFSMMRGLADGAKYGSFAQVKKLNLHTAHLEMEKLIEEAEQIRKQNTL